ncbi:cytochrome P450 [Xylariomycetidae sp. FL2044]|nr:cytochrome P450 [Xylariomycetidae sp. FL2044]
MVASMEDLLSSTILLPGIGGLLLAYLIQSYVSSWYRLRHVDGPFLASFTYLWMFRQSLKRKQAAIYHEVTQKYGLLARIGPNDLITGDPEIIRRMGSARSKYGRSSWYGEMRVDPYIPSGIAIMDTATHDKMKAQLSFGYGGKENPTVEDDVDTQVNGLLGLIRRKYLSSDSTYRPMDFALAVNYFTLDALTKIAYGKEFGYMETDSDVFQYIETSRNNVCNLALCGEVPALGRIVFSDTVLKLFGPKTTDKSGTGQMMAIAQKLVQDRFGPDAKDKKDMLGSFIRHGVDKRQCEAEIPAQILAGSDTTSTGLRGTMLSILTSPFCYFRLRDEIDRAVAAGKASSPIKLEEAKGLEYLQAVIYEGLRMNIPFSGLLMKEVPPEGDTIDGKFIPGGTRIGHSVLSLQRSKVTFGDDAEVFRPERWLDIDESKRRLMRDQVELVFGYGRWGCSGKSIAFMELNKVYFETIAKLLRHYDFQLVYPKAPMHTENINLFFEKDMFVKITERSGTSVETL